MNKIILMGAFWVLFSLKSFGQLEPKVDVYGGWAPVLGKEYPIKGGPIVDLEGKMWFRDKFLVGLRLGVVNIQNAATNAKSAPTVILHGVIEKRVELSNFKVFMGGSAGLYRGGQTTRVAGVPTDAQVKSNIGYAPRIAIQSGPYILRGEFHNRINEKRFFSFTIGYTLAYEE